MMNRHTYLGRDLRGYNGVLLESRAFPVEPALEEAAFGGMRATPRSNRMATHILSPFATFDTSAPISSTIPAASVPEMKGKSDAK